MNNTQGCSGAYSPGCTDLIGATCIPMGARVLVMSPNDGPNLSKGPLKLQKLKILKPFKGYHIAWKNGAHGMVRAFNPTMAGGHTICPTVPYTGGSVTSSPTNPLQGAFQGVPGTFGPKTAKKNCISDTWVILP